MKKLIDVKAGTVTFTFEGDLQPSTISAADLSEAILEHAKLAGLSHKIGDNAAISKSEENGFVVTEAMRKAAVDQMIAQLTGGDWNAKGGSTPKLHPSIIKLAAKWGISYEAAEARIASLDDI